MLYNLSTSFFDHFLTFGCRIFQVILMFFPASGLKSKLFLQGAQILISGKSKIWTLVRTRTHTHSLFSFTSVFIRYLHILTTMSLWQYPFLFSIPYFTPSFVSEKPGSQLLEETVLRGSLALLHILPRYAKTRP